MALRSQLSRQSRTAGVGRGEMGRRERGVRGGEGERSVGCHLSDLARSDKSMSYGGGQ